MNGSEVKMSKVLLSGDEAVARGAWEAGVSVAAAYPGTPSTEILENMAQYKDDVYATWANNEKIATEIAIGASIGGLRAFAAMKHVGMNVATDPMFTVAYTGVNGGLMLVTADDPGAHSSQNEQDNRLYAPHARMAMLEPSDSQECLDFTKAAFDISEKFDLVVELRMTTRVCHSKSIVELGPRQNVPPKKYESNPAKFSMLPAHARVRHYKVEENLRALAEYSETSPLNKVEHADSKLGIVASGINYMHAHESFGEGVGYLVGQASSFRQRGLLGQVFAEGASVNPFCHDADCLPTAGDGHRLHAAGLQHAAVLQAHQDAELLAQHLMKSGVGGQVLFEAFEQVPPNVALRLVQVAVASGGQWLHVGEVAADALKICGGTQIPGDVFAVFCHQSRRLVLNSTPPCLPQE